MHKLWVRDEPESKSASEAVCGYFVIHLFCLVNSLIVSCGKIGV